MADERPDPERLLERLQREEERARRAKLKLFFGAAAGVGKTYAMLLEAHERRAAGVDVVIGVVETHGRSETAQLLEGLERIPMRHEAHAGAGLPEFDLDAALARKPGLILVDELAHTNAPGSRHVKRWQDVEELLAAGIDVSTTLNVQHVDGLNDVVAQITGITVRETVPDSIVDRADEIELIDLPPDDLLQRLREGRVYVPAQAETAMRNFFRKGNLIALRELALRRTAERVDVEMESYRRDSGIAAPWAVRDRLLVCIGDPDIGLTLVRSARRMAAALKAQWIVAHVETPAELRWPQARRDYIVDVMGFASDLGAETVMLQGVRVADEVLALARARNVSRIVVGRPSSPRWRRWIEGSLAQTLVDGDLDADVYVIRGEPDGEGPDHATPRRVAYRFLHHLQAVGVVLAGTVVAYFLFPHFELTNLVMVYLLAVMVAGLWLGRGPAITASVLSVAAFDFFFVPPRYTFAVSDSEYLLTFAVMLATSLTVSTMAHWLRVQAQAAQRRERRTATLFRLSGELAALRTSDELLAAAARMIGEEFDGRAAILLPDAAGHVALRAGHLGTPHHQRHEIAVAQWVHDNGARAGRGTPTLPASDGLYLPLRGSTGIIGVLGLAANRAGDALRPDQMRFLETVGNQVALAIERGRLADQASRTQVEVESERLKNTMLSSISHDLRTPLAVITGAAGSLLEREGLPPAMARELAATIVEESRRLSRQVSNLLDMTRLESGAVQPRTEWHSLEEVVGGALERLSAALEDREVRVDVAAVPLVPLDDVLIGQVFVNLIENALRHTPPGSPIEIRAAREDGAVRIEVADRGPGFAPGTEPKVFDKFFRGQGGHSRGVGLGLAICRGFVEVHGGRIEAANRPEGGAVVRFWLPIAGEPPVVEPESAGLEAAAPRESP
jgi:two-component system, OmpR family, sensor histidine kinase KdpD